MSTEPVEVPQADAHQQRTSSRPVDKFAAASEAKKRAKRLRHRKTIRRSNSNG